MQWISFSRLLALLFALFVLCAAPLHAQFDAARIFQQNEAVKARYADPAVQYDTPGFAPGRTDFTSHAEMLEFVYGLQARSDNLHIRIVGTSQEGRPIPLLVLSNSGFTAAVDLQRLNRPIVFLVGLQHGNEPAGGEAMLVLAQQLATGPLRPLLDKLTIVILPHGNPDGAHYFRRSPHGTVDINRDHIKVELPETQALHRAVNEFQPHVFAERLARSGIDVRQLRKPATLEVESYDVIERRAGAVYVEGHPLSSVTTEVSVKQRHFPAGTYVIPMAQPNAAVIAAALEPESPSSFVTFGIIPVDKKGSPVTIAAPSEVPTWRLTRPVALDVKVVEPR